MVEPQVPSLPAWPDCRVIELRQYTLHRGQRDVLIELFDREFIEPQEAAGMRVLGQFRDLDHEDRFVWLRGFADMASRAAALQRFYGGPVWAAHRAAANATMVDSDDVLLLRPAWPGSAIEPPPAQRAAAGSTAAPPGLLLGTMYPLREPAGAELLQHCRQDATAGLQAAGAIEVGWCVTEPSPNNFPRLPVREGETVLVCLALFPGCAGSTPRLAAPDLSRWLSAPPTSLHLAPTARSALHC